MLKTTALDSIVEVQSKIIEQEDKELEHSSYSEQIDRSEFNKEKEE